MWIRYNGTTCSVIKNPKDATTHARAHLNRRKFELQICSGKFSRPAVENIEQQGLREGSNGRENGEPGRMK